MVMQQAPTLNPTAREEEGPKERGVHAYYRKANGWIVTAPAWPTFRADMEAKGCEILPQYGVFTNGTFNGAPKERDNNGALWNPADEPWRLLFQRGGAREFCIDQIIAYRWHLKPPYREVKFPQLEGVDIVTLYCPECERGVFAALTEPEAAEQLRIHLMSGFDDRHSYTPKDMTDLAAEWGINLMPKRIGRRPVRAEGKPSRGQSKADPAPKE